MLSAKLMLYVLLSRRILGLSCSQQNWCYIYYYPIQSWVSHALNTLFTRYWNLKPEGRTLGLYAHAFRSLSTFLTVYMRIFQSRGCMFENGDRRRFFCFSTAPCCLFRTTIKIICISLQNAQCCDTVIPSIWCSLPVTYKVISSS